MYLCLIYNLVYDGMTIKFHMIDTYKAITVSSILINLFIHLYRLLFSSVIITFIIHVWHVIKMNEILNVQITLNI